MSLITCPECAHEVSTAANACPNCGYTFVKPVVQRNVVVAGAAGERNDFPKWIFIPLGILGVVLLFILLAYMRNNNDENASQRNIGVNVSAPRSVNSSTDSTLRGASAPNEVVVPPSSSGGQIVVPQTSAPSTAAAPPSSSTTTTVPATETAPPDKGSVSLEAKVLSKSGTAQPVRGTRFYLLKKDAESILSEADIDNETGQSSLLTALGMATVYPSQYGDFSRKAMSAISRNAVYNATTDAGGKLQLKDVKPNSYYLFAITKTGSGFAVWSSPVTIQAGQNSLVLEPVRPIEVTEQPDSN